MKVHFRPTVEFVPGLYQKKTGGLTEYLVRRHQFLTNSPQDFYTQLGKKQIKF